VRQPAVGGHFDHDQTRREPAGLLTSLAELNPDSAIEVQTVRLS